VLPKRLSESSCFALHSVVAITIERDLDPPVPQIPSKTDCFSFNFTFQSFAVDYADPSNAVIMKIFQASRWYGLSDFIRVEDSRVCCGVQYVNPLGYMTQCATIWLTVLIAVNRYIAICHPFKANRFLTIRTARIQV